MGLARNSARGISTQPSEDMLHKWAYIKEVEAALVQMSPGAQGHLGGAGPAVEHRLSGEERAHRQSIQTSNRQRRGARSPLHTSMLCPQPNSYSFT